MGRIEDFIAAIGRTSTCDAVLSVLAAAGRALGFSVVAVGEAPGSGVTHLTPFFYSTWPAGWYEYYREAGLVGEDAVVSVARRAMMPVMWEDFEQDLERWRLQPEDLRAIELAREYGASEGRAWKTGWIVPVFGPHDYSGLVSWCGDPHDFGVADRVALHVKSLYAHNRMLDLHREAYHSPRQIIAAYRLTKREVQVLEGLVGGRPDAAIAARTGLAERTVQHHVTQAKKKLGCATRAQLAAAASRLRIV